MMTFIKNTNKQKHIPTGYQLVNIYDTLKRYKLYTNDYDLYRRIINIKKVTIEHID